MIDPRCRLARAALERDEEFEAKDASEYGAGWVRRYVSSFLNSSLSACEVKDRPDRRIGLTYESPFAEDIEDVFWWDLGGTAGPPPSS
jgi:hypothetical protein